MLNHEPRCLMNTEDRRVDSRVAKMRGEETGSWNSFNRESGLMVLYMLLKLN